MLEPTKKKQKTKNKNTPLSKTKKKLQRDGRRGTIMVKSNPIPSRWVPHKLENNNIKEVPPLLWSFGTPHQASQPGDPTKGLEIPRESDLEGQWDLLQDLHRPGGTETPGSENTNKILHAPRLRVKKQWLHRKLSQNFLLVLAGLL